MAVCRVCNITIRPDERDSRIRGHAQLDNLSKGFAKLLRCLLRCGSHMMTDYQQKAVADSLAATQRVVEEALSWSLHNGAAAICDPKLR